LVSRVNENRILDEEGYGRLVYTYWSLLYRDIHI